MLSSSISTIVKKSTRALHGKDSDNSTSKNENQDNSIHHPNRRPIDIIQTDTEAEEGDKYNKTDKDAVQEIGKDFRHEFDEASLSTHGSYHQVPVQNVLINIEERNVHHGLCQDLTDQDDDTLDQLRVEAEAFLDDQKKKNAELQQFLQQNDKELTVDDDGTPKISREELPFDCDDSLLGSSSLDCVLRRIKEDVQEQEHEKQPGIVCNTATESPDVLNREDMNDDSNDAVGVEDEASMKNDSNPNAPNPVRGEDDKDFDGEAFSDLGKLMFKKQRDRLNSHGDSSSKATPTKADANANAPFDEGPSSSESASPALEVKPTIIDRLIPYLPQVILLSILLSPLFYSRNDDIVDVEVSEDAQDNVTVEHQYNCSEESFHYAMYHLSNIKAECSHPESTTEEGTAGLLYSDIGTALFITTVLGGIVLALYDVSLKRKGAKGSNVARNAQVSAKKRHSRTPFKPKLQREVNSLEKKNIFPSSFVTDIVSPRGGIETVKRSSRIVKLSSSKQAASSARTDMKGENDITKVKSTLQFDDEYEEEKIKSVVKAEK